MGRMADILMKRDGITREEAEEQISSCRAACHSLIADGDFNGVEDELMLGLGLEMDYAVDLLI